MMPDPKHRVVTLEVIHPGQALPRGSDWEGTTAEERIDAVWELTLLCLEWSGGGEPRLQRSICRVKRAQR